MTRDMNFASTVTTWTLLILCMDFLCTPRRGSRWTCWRLELRLQLHVGCGGTPIRFEDGMSAVAAETQSHVSISFSHGVLAAGDAALTEPISAPGREPVTSVEEACQPLVQSTTTPRHPRVRRQVILYREELLINEPSALKEPYGACSPSHLLHCPWRQQSVSCGSCTLQ